jgi:hypothetical protein
MIDPRAGTRQPSCLAPHYSADVLRMPCTPRGVGCLRSFSTVAIPRIDSLAPGAPELGAHTPVREHAPLTNLRCEILAPLIAAAPITSSAPFRLGSRKDRPKAPTEFRIGLRPHASD